MCWCNGGMRGVLFKMDDSILLVDSTICRLCAEENINGTQLFNKINNCENEPDLSTTINRYLPIKVREDGKLPKTICPGCNIQLEAMVQFMELIITGQQKLREILKIQNEIQKNKEKTKKLLGENLFKSDLDSFTIQAVEEDGKEILIQIMPDGSLYSPDHDLSLKVEGLEKPRRKRGRPPKPPPEPENDTKEENDQNEDDDNDILDADGRKRRRRKVPPRLLETVQGKELDRIFREEGVIDENSSSDDEQDMLIKKEAQSNLADDEVIGHLENLDGQDLGEIVVLSKSTNRYRKIKKNKKKYICEICNRGFMHHETYLLHKVYHKESKFECMGCNELFENIDNLSVHQLETGHVGRGVVESLENQDITEEISDEITEAEENIEKKINCEKCNKNFTSKHNFDIHVKAIHKGEKPFQCDKCDKTFAYQASLKSHLVSHENDKQNRGYSCDLCDKLFNHPSSVVYHKEAEHNNGRRFVCNKCKKTFKHKQLLQRHQLVHSNERPFACKNCNATFKTKANLINHMPTHTGVKKYFCQQCGQLFAHKTSLTLHYRWHSGQKPYECPICNKAFSQKGNLQEHMRIHTGEKPYNCDHCDRKFTTSSQYKLHIKRHTGERPWSCEICSKSFLHKDTWKCHMRRHRDERPYQCDECQRGFTEQHALRKHMRLHTGEKPYTCDICGKAFADCSNLTKHKKVHNLKGKLQNLVAQTATGDGNQIYYVTFEQDSQNSEEIPVQTLVQILEENPSELTDNISTDQVITETNDDLTNSLVMPEQPPELQLGDLDDTNETLPLPPNQVQIQDEEGNPIYYTTQSGEQLRVLTFDGENLHVRTDDEQIIPIQLNIENGKPIAVAVDSEDINTKDITMDDIINTKVGDKSVDDEANDVNNLINQSMHFITEDGQNVCFVLDSENMNPNYLSIN